MTPAQALVLVERFDQLSPAERAELLQWARTIPLHYGAWQPFKKGWKILDTRALDPNTSLSNDDIELLGAMAARLDGAAIGASQPRLVPIEIPTDLYPSKEVKWKGLRLYISGRTRYDWSGWRLLMGEETSQSGWGERFGALRRALGWSEKAAESKDVRHRDKNIRAAWDFNAREYIGQVDKITLEGDVLSIKDTYSNRTGKLTKIDISDPAFPHLSEAAPRPETMQYMKRRVRRLLRELSEKQAERFWQVLAGVLHESARLTPDGKLNPATQWAQMWALHGAGGRWEQKPLARGPYRLKTGASPFQRTRREESAPEIWDAHLSQMSDWARDTQLPLQANLVALQVLAGHKQERPSLGMAQALRFMNGDVLWLKTLATREIGALWLGGETVSGALAAATVLQAPARLRRQLQSKLETQLPTVEAQWRSDFMKQALQILNANPRHQRAKIAAGYVARFGRLDVNEDDLFAHLPLWLGLGEDAAQWALERVQNVGAKGNTKRLDDIVALSGEMRERVLQAFLSQAHRSAPSKDAAWQQVSNGDADRNQLGWRYLEATGINAKTLRDLWRQLLRGWHNEEIFGPAFGSSSAARLLLRAEWSAKDVTDLFNGYYSGWSRMLPHLSVEFAQAVMHFVPPEDIAKHIFSALPKLRAEVAPQMQEAFASYARDWSPKSSEIESAIVSPAVMWPYTQPNEAAMLATWRFLEVSAVTDVTLQEIWQRLFALPLEGERVAPAIALLRRTNLSAEQIEKWLQESPELSSKFAPNFFAALFSLSSGSGKVALSVSATPEQWRAARPLLVGMLDDAALRGAFWNAIWEQLRGDGENLQARLLDDRDILASFAQLPNATAAEMMATDEPSHTPLLERWLDAHEQELQRDDVALIAAATCPLTEIRERGLARVQVLGLDLPLALRLIESNLPPAANLARSWFDAAPSGSDEEAAYAIALCDSPQNGVREWGRNWVERRADTLLNAKLLAQLTEGGDANNQAFVARQLQTRGENVDTREFDSAVLKSRGRARMAKTAVQKRLSQQAIPPDGETMNPQALLELARGRVPRDREWALQQLARLAQNGVAVEGVELVNVASDGD